MSAKRRESVTLDKAIEEFFDVLKPAQLAKITLDSKRRTLAALTRAAGRTNRGTRKLTDQDFEACLALLAEGLSPQENEARRLRGLAPVTGRSPASLRQDRACLDQFVKFLRKREWVRASFDPLYELTRSSRPAGDTDPEKVRKRRSVAHAEWADLLEAASGHHPRTRMIVAIGIYCGRRASEIAHMQWKHVRGDRVEFFNIKKGRAVDSEGMLLSPGAQAELARWQRWVEKAHGPVQPDWYVIPAKPRFSDQAVADYRCHSYLYPVDPTRPVLPKTITEDVQSALQRLGWTKEMLLGEGAHTLRRSMGTEVAKRGGTEAAQAGYDHKTPAQTQHYTGNVVGRIKLEKALSTLTAETDEPAPEPEPAQVPEQRSNVVSLTDWRARHAG